VLALWTGFTFVGYFTPIKGLSLEFLQLSSKRSINHVLSLG
jgi:hypothetical protein